MGYEFHRIFCGAPWELEAEREAFYRAMAEINENEAMKRGILLVSLSIIPTVASVAAFQGAIDENIRSCRYYIQVLGDNWGPPVRSFEQSFELARKCAADPALPMREVLVAWKKIPAERSLEAGLRQLKETPPEGIRTMEFSDTDSFQREVRALLSRWLEQIVAEKETARGMSSSAPNS